MGNNSTSEKDNKLKLIEIAGLNSKTTGADSIRENKVLKTEASHVTLGEVFCNTLGAQTTELQNTSPEPI